MTADLTGRRDYWLCVTVGYVARQHGLDPEDLARPARGRIMAAKREAIAEADRLGYSSVEIGRFLGLHHTTVLHHLGRTTRRQETP